MEELIAKVIAARKAAEAEFVHPDNPPLSEAQEAKRLIAQVHAILDHSVPWVVGPPLEDLLARMEKLEAKFGFTSAPVIEAEPVPVEKHGDEE